MLTISNANVFYNQIPLVVARISIIVLVGNVDNEFETYFALRYGLYFLDWDLAFDRSFWNIVNCLCSYQQTSFLDLILSVEFENLARN